MDEWLPVVLRGVAEPLTKSLEGERVARLRWIKVDAEPGNKSALPGSGGSKSMRSLAASICSNSSHFGITIAANPAPTKAMHRPFRMALTSASGGSKGFIVSGSLGMEVISLGRREP
jgi:hypothetical protein